MNEKLIQLIFNRNANKLVSFYDLYEQVANELLSRVEYLKFKKYVLLDLGSGLNIDSKILSKYFNKSLLLKIDFSLNILKLFGSKLKFYNKFFPKNQFDICANVYNLPIKNESVDLVWSNMCLPFISDTKVLFKQVYSCLQDNGLFVASSLGPQTFLQLDELGLRKFDFIDMHDLGDNLGNSGFSDIVVSSEIINLVYSDPLKFLEDIKLIGCGSSLNNYKYLTKNNYFKIKKKLDNLSYINDLTLTIEVIFIHGWKNNLKNNTQKIKFLPSKYKNNV